METNSLLPIVLMLILCLIYYAVNLIRDHHFFDKHYRRRRRVSGASTPPRTLPLEKKVNSNEPPSTDHRYTLPPSTRDTLAEVVSSLPSERKKQFNCSMLSPDEILKNMVPFDVPFDKWGPRNLTPTGISTQEIQALGDFPDYARLSGVPLPQEYPEFDIHRAMPRPYRPLRWAYHQTMCEQCHIKATTFQENNKLLTNSKPALTKLEPDWWLELERTYVERVQQRMSLFAQHGPAVLDYLPGSEHACKELMEMCIQFVCARYPHYFSLSSDKTVLHNAILQTDTHLKEMHPLHILLRNIPEDFAVIMRNPQDGYYYLRAGVLCSSLGWHLGTKLGLQLAQIHQPVPDYREKMRFSMDRYVFD